MSEREYWQYPEPEGGEMEELEARYMDASPAERPALLRAFCEKDPDNPKRRGFADALAHGFYTEAELRRLEHFRDGAR